MSGSVTVTINGMTKTVTEGDTLTLSYSGDKVRIESITPNIAKQWDNRESLNLKDPFEKAVFELVEMNRRKRKDYATDGDPFSNFIDTSGHFGLAVWESAEFNLVQKLARLRSLRANGRMEEPENESVLDTYLDAAVYAVIMYALYRKFAWSGER